MVLHPIRSTLVILPVFCSHTLGSSDASLLNDIIMDNDMTAGRLPLYTARTLVYVSASGCFWFSEPWNTIFRSMEHRIER